MFAVFVPPPPPKEGSFVLENVQKHEIRRISISVAIPSFNVGKQNENLSR